MPSKQRPGLWLSTILCSASLLTPVMASGAQSETFAEPLAEPRQAVAWDGSPRHAPEVIPAEIIASTGPGYPEVMAGQAQSKWTILLYIAGDNDLEPWVVEDIETELGLVGSNDDIQLVALADRIPGYDQSGGNWTDTHLFHIKKDQLATEPMAELGELNFGEAETLSDFILWGKAQFPAERYALVFWDHGWGWRPSQTMLDYTNRDALDQEEIRDALELAGPVDLIAWDACMMATLEVQSTVAPYAKAMVGSEDYVGYSGFRYEEILSALVLEPEMDAEALAIHFSQSMRDRTASAVALNGDWHALNMAVSDLGEALIDALPDYREAIDRAREKSQIFGDPMNKDLYDMALQLQAEVPVPAVQRAVEDILVLSDRVRLHEWHRDIYESAHGTTLYWPAHRRDMWSRYSQEVVDFDYYQTTLSFAKASKWDDFLRAYVKRDN